MQRFIKTSHPKKTSWINQENNNSYRNKEMNMQQQSKNTYPNRNSIPPHAPCNKLYQVKSAEQLACKDRRYTYNHTSSDDVSHSTRNNIVSIE